MVEGGFADVNVRGLGTGFAEEGAILEGKEEEETVFFQSRSVGGV